MAQKSGTETVTTFCDGIDCAPFASSIHGIRRGADSSETNINSQEKRVSEWEMLLRKFSEAHKDECNTVSLDIPRVKRAKKTFPTGSSYEGTWDVLGMSGYGTYTFPNGVIYEGEFLDGMFHGCGELRYPCGSTLEGKWKRGVMTERTLIFPDGLEYSEHNWQYCVMPDRRFTIEIAHGLQPAGRSYHTAKQPTRDIPEGFYDTGDGFYDPETKVVYSPTDATHIVRKPSVREQNWIMNNCRTNPMKPIGPQLSLYEEWSKPQQSPEFRSGFSTQARDSTSRKIEVKPSGCRCTEAKTSNADAYDSITKGTWGSASLFKPHEDEDNQVTRNNLEAES